MQVCRKLNIASRFQNLISLGNQKKVIKPDGIIIKLMAVNAF